MEPLLIEVPEEFETQRLLLRVPRVGDGKQINAAVVESAAELARFMPWSVPTPTVDNTEAWVRKAAAHFLTREQLNWKLLLKTNEQYVGTIGLPRLDWSVPRFEVGYWLRTSMGGQGYMTEAVRAVTEMALDRFKAQRVEIHTDDRNIRSARVAERAGFDLEGILRRDTRCKDGYVRDTRVYSRIASNS